MLDRLLTALGGMIVPGGENAPVREAYQQAAEGFFGSGTAFAFWKGRIALYAILKALDIGPGDEVIVPGYTCVMVPGPVIYTGATPIYVDIEPEFYITPAADVADRISPRTKAILVQHTYGFPAPVREIRTVADQRGIPILEDCCHTFGGRVNGELLGTLGTAAFFSGQWNKPYSTGLGGLALVHDQDLAARVRAEQAKYPVPGRKAAFMLASQLLVYEVCLYPSTTALATRLFRWMTKKGLVVGSSSSAEFESSMPANYALGPAPVQCRLGRREVGRAAANLAKRSHATQRYLAELPKLGYRVPRIPEHWDTPLLRFPLRVANKEQALAQAARHGVEIGSWFECPLHPIETDHKAFCYLERMCPVSEKATAEVINLPTHRRVSDRDIDKTLAFVRDVCRPA
ncbi:MAG: DegT/DnrJ/EryC1/StrS family aminotransferase [Phycisphaerae bacterium]|nr:DegT/DnrJ/EryC1/StrS family aminotransferase [Phycisphaerae bacterium]